MLKIGAIVWGVKDLKKAIEFWSAALDYELKYPADIDWAMLAPKKWGWDPAVAETCDIGQG